MIPLRVLHALGGSNHRELFQPQVCSHGRSLRISMNTIACHLALRRTFNLLSVVVLIATADVGQAHAAAPIAFPGKAADWHGFRRFDFEVAGKPATVVVPERELPGRPWVWHGEFFGHKPAPDIALLQRGFHIVYLRVPDLLGSPEAVGHWNAFYRELTTKYGFAKRAALVGLSRGGLYCYNWAAANPDCVACIYADAPVCDFKSWPGGKGRGKGSPRDWKLVLERYPFADEAAALAYDKNPIDNLAPLAKAGVPLLHVYGDADDVVPWEENTKLVAERYRKLGGSITLIAKPGVGHHPHGLDDPTPIVEFIVRHAAPVADSQGDLRRAAAGVTQIVGHRGSSIDRPENTRAGALRAIAVGATAVEVDVRTTRDGRLVLSHDADVSRTSNGSGLIGDKTWDELQRLDVGNRFGPQFTGERIPSLAEMLELCRGRVDVLLDLKEQGDDYDRRVAATVQQHGDPRGTIVGVRSVAQARQFRQLLPEARQLGLIGAVQEIEAYAAAGVETIRLWPKWLGDPTCVERVRRAGAKLHLNQVSGDREEFAQLLRHRPESIAGDDPATIVVLLQRLRAEPPTPQAQPLYAAGVRIADRFVQANRHERNYRFDLALGALLELSEVGADPKYLQHVLGVIDRRGWQPTSDISFREQSFTCLNYRLFQTTRDRAWLPVFLAESRKCREQKARSLEGAVLHPRGRQRGGGEALLLDDMQEFTARMARAGAHSGDAAFFAEAARQIRLYRAIVRDPQTGLWHQGRGWLSDRPDAVSPGTWSRGHGWLLRGLTAAVAEMPRDSEEFREMQATLVELADALVTRQQPSGMWHCLLDRPATASPPESSGTAMIATALARAWREGTLVGDRYREAADRAFQALPQYVDSAGLVLGVSPGPGPLESEEPWLVASFPPDNDHGPFALMFAAAEAVRFYAPLVAPKSAAAN
jgi:rhamnogalacturonyl hydrolase YesR/glycerophosphoryl diester phosphodiesterase/pimeloyl-ACP methyl ester carboxylesterase